LHGTITIVCTRCRSAHCLQYGKSMRLRAIQRSCLSFPSTLPVKQEARLRVPLSPLITTPYYSPDTIRPEQTVHPCIYSCNVRHHSEHNDSSNASIRLAISCLEISKTLRLYHSTISINLSVSSWLKTEHASIATMWEHVTRIPQQEILHAHVTLVSKAARANLFKGVHPSLVKTEAAARILQTPIHSHAHVLLGFPGAYVRRTLTSVHRSHARTVAHV